MCPMHSEAKQAQMSEFGAQKGSLQGITRKISGSSLKTPELPRDFQGVFTGKIWAEGPRE